MDWLTKALKGKLPTIAEDATQVLGDDEEAERVVKELEAARVKSRAATGLVVKSGVPAWLLQFVKDAQRRKPAPPARGAGIFALLKADEEHKAAEQAERGRAQAERERKFWKGFGGDPQ
jgi:hypothetical protein